MNYRLPEEWEPYITTTPYVNESGIFSYAEGELIKGPFGTLLKRCSEENGYRLWLHELEVNQPFQFQLSFPKPTASIMYMLEGEMVYPDEEMPHVLATSGFYYLSYMPVLNLPVIVQAGRHTLLQLDLSEKLLEVVGLKYYGTFEIWNSLQQDSLDGYIRDVCPITEPVRNLLHQLLHCDMEEEERMLHHYARFIDLLLLYFKHRRRSIW
ncbi:hypothetical protein MKQ70_18095 [Chitinophaga sedimenti]|uniref:hypothetical protein n=1 Tax=Chitinophaga sedimenti TaxID=2033606 RepID=UPI0020042A4A|nr:hypothetical protein [Chitinophaga sedimenti]MCK7556827.1 hypothetical protein [Chitinophaga sedimenti]